MPNIVNFNLSNKLNIDETTNIVNFSLSNELNTDET